MTGRINSGQLCTVEPVGTRLLVADDIVLCTVKGNQYLHLITAIAGASKEESARYQISNNKGYVNGWIGRRQIHGRCVRVEP